MAENTTQILTLSNFSGGIGSDKYLSLANGCYDGEGLDIRRGKRIILNTHNQNNTIQLPNSSTPTCQDGYYISSSNKYIYSYLGATLYKFDSTSYGSVSTFITKNISGTSYILTFAGNAISRFPTSGITTLQTYTLIPATGDWIVSGGYASHNIGNTTTLTGGSAVNGKRYKIVIVATNITAGNITVGIGGATPETISANGTYTYFFTASTTAGIVVTPTSDFNGRIESANVIYLCNVEEGYYIMTGGDSSTTISLLEDTGDLYIGNGKDLWILDPTGVLVKTLSFSIGSEIVAITKIDDQFIIWERDAQGSRVHYWDGTSAAPSRTIYWYNEIIQNVVNQGNYHLVLTGGDYGIKKVWKSNGNQKTMLYQIREGNWWSTTSDVLTPALPIYYGGATKNAYVNNVESFGDLVFLPGYNKVLVYGKRIPGFSDAMFCDYTYRDTNNDIISMYAYDGQISVGYGNGKVITWKLDNYESIQDATTKYYFGKRGYISFNPIVFLASQEKNGIKMKLGIKTPTNTFMNIYYALDRETDIYTFVIDESTNPVTTDPTVGAVYGHNSTIGRYTVTKVTKFLHYMFIETQETVKKYTPKYGTTLDKISGTGDSSITYVDFHNYRHFDIVTDTTELKKRQRTRLFQEVFTEIQFRVEMITEDQKYTPELNDFTLIYDNINNE